MRKLICGLGVAAICSAGLVGAERTHVPLTLVGCVHKGVDADTFVLTNLQTEGGKVMPAPTTYWLSSTEKLAEHVGHKVQVSGTYSPERDAGKTARVKIETDSLTGEQTIELENGIKKVEGTTGAVGTSGVRTIVTQPYRRLEVTSLKMVARNCR